jgi:hypothetical protein
MEIWGAMCMCVGGCKSQLDRTPCLSCARRSCLLPQPPRVPKGPQEQGSGGNSSDGDEDEEDEEEEELDPLCMLPYRAVNLPLWMLLRVLTAPRAQMDTWMAAGPQGGMEALTRSSTPSTQPLPQPSPQPVSDARGGQAVQQLTGAAVRQRFSHRVPVPHTPHTPRLDGGGDAGVVGQGGKAAGLAAQPHVTWVCTCTPKPPVAQHHACKASPGQVSGSCTLPCLSRLSLVCSCCGGGTPCSTCEADQAADALAVDTTTPMQVECAWSGWMMSALQLAALARLRRYNPLPVASGTQAPPARLKDLAASHTATTGAAEVAVVALTQDEVSLQAAR